ncbi:hypothetical protein N7476_000167 [Penicillium atrosanguineum]|uniref:C2H2-type domain-containing protein n=1 Tax=Penicillium atrosanguineum TaxID=1132637 RepID=A0A9W9QCD6_9EURO|nr:hypothetical protein N7476_000167 [Penicillium atrosanguineum]
MDQIPVHYRSLMAHSIPEDTHTFDASATYPSPVSATTSQGLNFSPIGLGISGCDLEPGFDNLRAFPHAVPFAASHAPSNQMITTENYYEAPMKVDHFSSGPCFSNYNGVPPASNTPLSLYDSQTIGLSPNYNSALELDGPVSYAGQIPAYWTPTPCSGPTTPLEAASATGHWNQPYFPEPCITVNPPTIPVDRGSYHPTTVTDGSRTLASHYNPAQTSSSPRSATSTESFSPNPPQNVNKNRNLNNHMDKDMEDGRKCPVCGYVFTRRSNCTEHQKRHDPSFKKTFNCSGCKKTFGRNADLRRHIDNASQRKGPKKGTG